MEKKIICLNNNKPLRVYIDSFIYTFITYETTFYLLVRHLYYVYMKALKRFEIHKLLDSKTIILNIEGDTTKNYII